METIRITENQIKKIIAESVKAVLHEAKNANLISLSIYC